MGGRARAERNKIDSAEIDEPTPEFWDAVKTVASLLAIGVLGTLTIWWLS